MSNSTSSRCEQLLTPGRRAVLFIAACAVLAALSAGLLLREEANSNMDPDVAFWRWALAELLAAMLGGFAGATVLVFAPSAVLGNGGTPTSAPHSSHYNLELG